MSDFVKDLLCLGDNPAAASRHERRRAMNQLVQMLLAMAETGGDGDDANRALVIRLTEIIGGMTAKIAHADDATFSAIVREAAMLVQSLQRRQAGGMTFRLH